MKEAQPQRILIVDDEPMVCAAIKMMLEVHGYKSQCVGSGAEALTRLESERFNVVITDYSMRGMKGDELSRLAKQRWPQMPILMLTAYAAALDDKCFSSADAVLCKPCSMQELNDAVASVSAAGTIEDIAAADEIARLQAAKNNPQSSLPPDAPRNPRK